MKEFPINVSDEVHKKALQFAVDKAGTPYSIKQLFGILIYMVTGKIIFKDGRSSYVCSELAGQMLNEDFGIGVSKDLDIIIPRDIYEIMDKG